MTEQPSWGDISQNAMAIHIAAAGGSHTGWPVMQNGMPILSSAGDVIAVSSPGFIPVHMMRMVGFWLSPEDKNAAIEELIEANLWGPVRGGYYLCDPRLIQWFTDLEQGQARQELEDAMGVDHDQPPRSFDPYRDRPNGPADSDRAGEGPDSAP